MYTLQPLINNYLYCAQTSDIDNQKLYEDCRNIESTIKAIAFKDEHRNIENYQGSLTSAFQWYNLLSFHIPSINKLAVLLREVIRPVLPKEDYIIQCWLNIFRKDQFLPRHEHWPDEFRSFHGYYCVYVEDSITTYNIPPDNTYKVKNKEGLLVFGKSKNDTHWTSPWTYDKPRITIAFDIVPLNTYTSDPGHKIYDPHFVLF